MKKILLSAVLFTLSLHAELTPELYFELDFKVKDLSIQRQEAHIKCAEDACSAADHFHLDGDYQEQTFDIYKAYGTTPIKSLKYATKNREAIQAYLAEHEELQNKIEVYKQDFELLSAELESKTGAL